MSVLLCKANNIPPGRLANGFLHEVSMSLSTVDSPLALNSANMRVRIS